MTHRARTGRQEPTLLVVLVPTLDPIKVPFRLVLNDVSQFRYTNTLLVESTYTDHLGQVHEVNKRNDFQLTRQVFYLSGFVFDPRLDFNILLYFSSATLSATAASGASMPRWR